MTLRIPICLVQSLIIAAGCFTVSRAQIQTVEDRITSLLDQMTMEEKIAQLHQNSGFTTADNLRLGIPGFIMSDGPHGVRDGKATSFPVGIGMASMWDRDVAFKIGVAMGEEFRGKGKTQALGPCLDLDRDPRNGRSPETGGEDPYLDAQTTTAVVKGIQSTPTIATIKHFNINHRENGRTTNNVIASKRMLNETNGLAFRTAVQEGGALCVMNAYNLINGQKCAENPALLTTILRNEWGFPFYVVSDWGSIWDTKKAIDAGCEIEMGSNLYAENLPTLVANNSVSAATIDQAVRRVLRTKIYAGLLDWQPEGDPDDVNSSAHQQLCLEAAQKSIVLLKNEGNILPLSKSISKLAVVGPSAAIAQVDGGGSAYVTPFYSISPKVGIETKIGAGNVMYAKGCDINSTDTSGFAAARSAAASSDAVVFVGGLDPSQESEGMDRATGVIDLPVRQQMLINELAKVNGNIVVVLYSGGICGVYNCYNSIKGFLYAFYPGQEAGNALADILFGDVNPSGKLPVTMPIVSGTLPPWNDEINAGLGGGYRWFDAMGYPIQYAFGYGRSYTTFQYSNLIVTPKSVPFGSPFTISVDVKNTGSRTGEEIVQLYLSQKNDVVPMPVKELKGFQRVALNPGETKSVVLTVTNDELYYFDESSNNYEVLPGEKTVMVGGSSDSLPLQSTITVLNGSKKPDLRITNIKMIPPYPMQGEKVTFAAMVKNEGTGASDGSTPVHVSYRIGGKEVAYSSTDADPIPAGGMALIEADGGPDNTNFWTTGLAGSFDVDAIVDPDGAIDECVEDNNSLTVHETVYSAPRVNSALNRPVIVSSVENSTLGGENAVDGNLSTRWSSAFSDPQYIIVDLGSVKPLSEILLYWESAYAKTYQVQISDDNFQYTTIYTTVTGDGGVDKITTTKQGRYIKVYCLQRATEWGYSLYEITVHTDEPDGVHQSQPTEQPATYDLSQNFPNPFNPSTTINFQVPEKTLVTIILFDLLGREVKTIIHHDFSTGRYSTPLSMDGLPSGVYYYRMSAGNFSRVQKCVYVK